MARVLRQAICLGIGMGQQNKYNFAAHFNVVINVVHHQNQQHLQELVAKSSGIIMKMKLIICQQRDYREI